MIKYSRKNSQSFRQMRQYADTLVMLTGGSTSQAKEHEIRINGEVVSWDKPTISYEEVVEIAYPGSTRTDYSMTYASKAWNGILTSGQACPVTDGMTINAYLTGNA